MKNQKNIIITAAIILFAILISTIILIPLFNPHINSDQKCHNRCLKDGWQDGGCQWPRVMNETEWNLLNKRQIERYNAIFPYAEIENRGSCVEAFLGVKSKHCGNEGQCNCYCFNYKKGYDEWLKNVK